MHPVGHSVDEIARIAGKTTRNVFPFFERARKLRQPRAMPCDCSFAFSETQKSRRTRSSSRTISIILRHRPVFTSRPLPRHTRPRRQRRAGIITPPGSAGTMTAAIESSSGPRLLAVVGCIARMISPPAKKGSCGTTTYSVPVDTRDRSPTRTARSRARTAGESTDAVNSLVAPACISASRTAVRANLSDVTLPPACARAISPVRSRWPESQLR